ncbi:MAG: META domain-containing protein [Nitrospira sp.]|nr:MAG: META domain-containing protein [Nitrospira sp.]
MPLFHLISLCASALVIGCVTTPSPDVMKQVAERNRWELAHWGDHAVPYGDDGEPVILTFKEGKVSGHAGCNRYSAGITFGPKTGHVSVSRGISTRMACEPRRMEFEVAFIRAFEASTRYRLDGESLSFESAIAQPLEFYRRPPE